MVAGSMSKIIEEHLLSLAIVRRKKAADGARAWARAAGQGVAHRVTKTPVGLVAFSASADKAYKGAFSQQEAADAGIKEWSDPWQASETDTAEDILRAVEAWECTSQTEPDIALPPLEEQRLFDACKRFRGGTDRVSWGTLGRWGAGDGAGREHGAG